MLFCRLLQEKVAVWRCGGDVNSVGKRYFLIMMLLCFELGLRSHIFVFSRLMVAFLSLNYFFCPVSLLTVCVSLSPHLVCVPFFLFVVTHFLETKREA